MKVANGHMDNSDCDPENLNRKYHALVVAYIVIYSLICAILVGTLIALFCRKSPRQIKVICSITLIGFALQGIAAAVPDARGFKSDVSQSRYFSVSYLPGLRTLDILHLPWRKVTNQFGLSVCRLARDCQLIAAQDKLLVRREDLSSAADTTLDRIESAKVQRRACHCNYRKLQKWLH